jgi:catechol 2,3-dioxygenase-like lactoylglutathione lyase family enzyme
MPIEGILLNVADVGRSVEFYSRFLGVTIVGEPTEETAVLDLVTATLELTRLRDPQPSTWVGDDLQRGFRHLGFKVDRIDPMVAELKSAGVAFHLDPLDAEGQVRITFFFDPDGTLLELVEGDLQYHSIASETGVASERALGVPARPRFDHVAVTVVDFDSAAAFYAPLDFEHIGTITQPNDPRGFQIDYLKGGDTVLEVFAWKTETTPRDPQLDALGFVAVQLAAEQGVVGALAVGSTAGGRSVMSDPDGLTFTVERRE